MAARMSTGVLLFCVLVAPRIDGARVRISTSHRTAGIRIDGARVRISTSLDGFTASFNGKAADCKEVDRGNDVFACFVRKRTLVAFPDGMQPKLSDSGKVEEDIDGQYASGPKQHETVTVKKGWTMISITSDDANLVYTFESPSTTFLPPEEIAKYKRLVASDKAIPAGASVSDMTTVAAWRDLVGHWYDGFIALFEEDAQKKYGVKVTQAELAFRENLFMQQGWAFANMKRAVVQNLLMGKVMGNADATKKWFRLTVELGSLFSFFESSFFLARLDGDKVAEETISFAGTPVAAVPPRGFSPAKRPVKSGCNGIEGSSRTPMGQCMCPRHFRCVRATTLASEFHGPMPELSMDDSHFIAKFRERTLRGEMGEQYHNRTVLMKCKKALGSEQCDDASRCFCTSKAAGLADVSSAGAIPKDVTADFPQGEAVIKTSAGASYKCCCKQGDAGVCRLANLAEAPTMGYYTHGCGMLMARGWSSFRTLKTNCLVPAADARLLRPSID